MFLAVLFTIIKRSKQAKYPKTDESLNKMRSIHTMEYHRVFKREEILTPATTWMNQKDRACMIPLI